jgi:hypothetical protein
VDAPHSVTLPGLHTNLATPPGHNCCSFSSRGFYMDGPSIVSSAVLLLVLLGLTFQRILGLDRFIAKAMRCVLNYRTDSKTGSQHVHVAKRMHKYG